MKASRVAHGRTRMHQFSALTLARPCAWAVFPLRKGKVAAHAFPLTFLQSHLGFHKPLAGAVVPSASTGRLPPPACANRTRSRGCSTTTAAVPSLLAFRPGAHAHLTRTLEASEDWTLERERAAGRPIPDWGRGPSLPAPTSAAPLVRPSPHQEDLASFL